MIEYPVSDVFGLSRDLPLNYVIRDKIDGELIDSLTRSKHLVIHGSSKQGKTSLRKNCLKESDYIVVTCQHDWDIQSLFVSVLKEAGFEVKKSTEKTHKGVAKISVSAKGGLTLPFVAKGEVNAGSVAEKGFETKTSYESLDLDPTDVNDIIRALKAKSFSRFIILEDFHYLPIETQRDFAFALKAFHENSKFCFIIVGVWKESNRLTRYNGDLTNRVISIDADLWATDELREVIESGEKLLNIVFPEEFKATLLCSCFESVYIVQEACYRACTSNNIFLTQSNKTTVSPRITATEVIRRVVEEQSGRFDQALISFSRGFQDTKLEMYKWLLFVVLDESPTNLEKGLKLNAINKKIASKHPQGSSLQAANLTNALSNIGVLQTKREIRPIIFDYDEQVLNVVDRAFLIWLSTQDKYRLMKMIDLPEYITSQ